MKRHSVLERAKKSRRRALTGPVISKNSIRETHFKSSVVGKFSEHLLKYRYVHSKNEDVLVLNPDHKHGEAIQVLDISHWEYSDEILQSLSLQGSKIIEFISSGNQTLTDEKFIQIFDHLHVNALLRVNISNCKIISRLGLNSILSFASIEELNISLLTNIDDEFIRLITISLLELKHLDLSNCENLTDQSLLFIANNVRNHLISLKASRNLHFTHVGATEVTLKCESLEQLDLSRCPNLSFLGVVVRTSSRLQYGTRSIRRINLDYCRLMHSEALLWVCSALPQVHEVSLLGIPQLTDAMVQGLVRCCPTVSRLEVGGCKQISSGTFQMIAQLSGSTMRKLSLSAVSPELNPAAVTELLSSCKTLRDIDLSDNKNVLDSAFEVQWRSRVAQRHIGVSEERVEQTRELMECVKVARTSISSFGVACLAMTYSQIRTLDVSGLDDINDTAVQAVASSCQQLRTFLANDCPGLTNGGVADLCRGCPRLSVLHLAFTLIPVDQALTSTAGSEQYCQYSDSLLRYLFGAAKHLVEVVLCNQRGLTFSSKWLRRGLPCCGNFSLQRLDLRGCNNIVIDHLSLTFSSCSALNDVRLPDKFLSTEVSSPRFWLSAFGRTVYTRPFSFEDVDRQKTDAEKSRQVTLVTKKQSIRAVKLMKSLQSLEGFHILQPRPDKDILEFRDKYVRRRMSEFFSASVIQQRWRVYSIWKRFRLRVMARRVAFTYKAILVRRERQQRVQQFTRRHAAKVIQKEFRCRIYRFFHAARTIQRMFQGWKRRQRKRLWRLQNKKVVCIQRWARGMLVRISEQWLLAQVYLKLPTFWKEVMNTVPPLPALTQTAANAAAAALLAGTSSQNLGLYDRPQRVIYPYEISELKENTTELLKHILEDIVTDRILPPKLPTVVAQPFDKSPYVSLSDGRKLTFYSDKQSVLTSEFAQRTRNEKNFTLSENSLKFLEGKNFSAAKVVQLQQGNLRESSKKQQFQNSIEALEHKAQNKLPVHVFNTRYWPLTDRPAASDPSTEEHDPTLNSFDVLQNSRKALHCSVCNHRLQVIFCKTCIKGYCFFCAFRVHNRKFSRIHQMELVEPRVVRYKEIGKSLVYHVDVAQSISYDLRYIVKFMRSAAELKRLKKEKEMLREYEAQEEKRKKIALEAQKESKEKHDAATKISLMFRCFKARAQVNKKRQQILLEKTIESELKFSRSIVMIQKLFRMHSVRMWLYKKGFRYRGLKYRLSEGKKRNPLGKTPENMSVDEKRTEMQKILTPSEVKARVTRDAGIRATSKRTGLMAELVSKHSATLSLLDANIKHWITKHEEFQPKIEKFDNLRRSLHSERKNESIKVHKEALNSSAQAREKGEIELKRMQMRVDAASEQYENYKNIAWWIEQIIRSHYRRKSILKARFEDFLGRMEWLAVESSLLSRLDLQMTKRIKKLRKITEMKHIAKWVERYHDNVASQLILVDTQQESTLKEEIVKTNHDKEKVLEYDALVEELIKSLIINSQYSAERVKLDTDIQALVYGSKQAIDLNERLIFLKGKQQILEGGAIDGLKVGLQQKFDDEDQANTFLYAFPTDEPDLTVKEMRFIEAVLMEKFNTAAPHCRINDFLSVYLLQPWLAEDSVEDVRYEERIKGKELTIGGKKEEVKDLQLKIDEINKRKNELNELIRESKVQIEVHFDPLIGESIQEGRDRVALVQQLQLSVGEMEAELGIISTTGKDLKRVLKPILAQIEEAENEIKSIRRQLRKRVDMRAKASKAFLDLEGENCKEFEPSITDEAVDLEGTIEKNRRDMHMCRSYNLKAPVAAVQEFLANFNTDIYEREAIQVPREDRKVSLQRQLSLVQPQRSLKPERYVQYFVSTREKCLMVNERYYMNLKRVLEEEAENLRRFLDEKDKHEEGRKAFEAILLHHRRQRALQKDIEHRIERLEELREIRLSTMQAIKRKQLEEERAIRKKKEEEERNRKTLAAILAAQAKKAIRGAKDYVRDLRYRQETEMDEEEKRMARNIREKSKDNAAAKPEALRMLHLTQGLEETEFFRKQNAHLKGRGLPFFVRMERSFGNQLYLWTQNTFDGDSFITSWELGHKDEGHELYIEPEMRKKRYQCVTHESTKLQIWVKRDPRKNRGYKSVQLSFTEQEELRLMADEYEKFDSSLLEFGLPDTFLWVQRVDKIRKVSAVDTNQMIAEVKKVRELSAQKPNDKNLKQLLRRLNEKLEEVYQKEKEAEVTDPLKVAIDLMALDEMEVDQWMKAFAKIDVRKVGRVTFDEMFDYFRETPTPVAKEIFYSCEATDEHDLVEFGDFIRAVGTFCFFGKEEVVRFLFVFIDRDHKGTVNVEQFRYLISCLSPYETKRVRRAMKILGLKSDQLLTINDFFTINGSFPALFLPAFLIQDSMRSKTMGTDWFFRKLSKYKNVRYKMAREGKNTDELVEMELQRFHSDQAKEARMKQRESEIKQESSELRKVILQARQFVDEFS